MLHNTRADLSRRAIVRRQGVRPARKSGWIRLLSQVLQLAGGEAELVRHGERPWASATFSGTRHTIALNFEGNAAVAAGERLIAVLPDHEFEIPGQIVADAAVMEVNHTHVPVARLQVEIELLLLEDL